MGKYLQVSKKIEELIIDNPKTAGSLSWLNVNSAGKPELEYLLKRQHFTITHLKASMAKSLAERAFIEKETNYIFIILHFPIIKDGLVLPAEVEFFMGHGYLVTIHNGDLPPLMDFFNICKKDENSLLAYELESSSVLLYEILDRLIKYCYEVLDSHSKRITHAQNTIFSLDSKQRDTASEILTLRHNIIKIRKILQNHKNILQSLTEMKSSLVPAAELKKYYSTLVEHSKRIWENLENQREMIEVLNDTNESLLNDRMNRIMKTLTMITVILYPLNLIAAIFGMNTILAMPFIGDPLGFWKILFIMFLSTVTIFLIFKRKNWI
ncbi:MAG TPA: magnesium transporter CorA family protein [bacterium]|jgi:magnesium transporter|nr:magnesium transporter CorA family protein [bacterium]HNZ51468.1 magnesium transporter CorA family protein [bacterium]HOH85277.1 magnesium transporter CorA family protein [bacterium]HPW44426.1 magnesium transporter CorA family protein [bacterium]HPX63942.1 magnesium transporter CorA family protein [bacterium]